MIQRVVEPLAELYETDETAWLEAMSELIREGRLEELDYTNLREYLADMARRDRREVRSRLTVLIAHLLKWMHQPRKRTRSWRATIVVQRRDLRLEIDSGVLRNHAEAVLEEAHADAVKQAIIETGVRADAFPEKCPYQLDQILNDEFYG